MTKTSGINALPQDRESLFYLNVREIPPKPDKPNVLQLAMQSRIKLFYRPAAIVPETPAQCGKTNWSFTSRASAGVWITQRLTSSP